MDALLQPIPLALPIALLALLCVGIRGYLKICELNRKLRTALARKQEIICELQTRIDNDAEDHG